MSSTISWVKWILNTINLLWGVVSLLTLAAASYLSGKAAPFVSNTMLTGGGIGLAASILGFCGIYRENVFMTYAYTFLILVSLSMQITSMAFSTNTKHVRRSAVQDVSAIWSYETQYPGSMDFMQESFECCGKHGPDDYTKLGRKHPDSCFSNGVIFTTGCLEKVQERYTETAKNVVNGSWAAIILNVLMLAFAIYLVIRFTRNEQQAIN